MISFVFCRRSRNGGSRDMEQEVKSLNSELYIVVFYNLVCRTNCDDKSDKCINITENSWGKLIAE